MTVEVYAPRATSLVEWAAEAAAASQLANTLAESQVIPEPFRRKPQEVTAVILLGQELGLTPITALRSMYVIRGQVGMYVRAQVALTQARGHRIWTEKETDTEVTVAGHRAGDPDHVERCTWSIGRANKAGFIRRGASGQPSPYETQPRAMLWARAAGELCHRIAADALQGVPEVEEPAEDHAPVGVASGAVQIPRRLPAPPPPPSLAAAPEEAEVRQVEVPEPGEVPVANPAAPDGPEPRLNAGQRDRIMASLGDLGITDRAARLAYLEKVLGREVTTTNTLTVTEASAVIDAIQWDRDHEPAE